ncbi:hypothetical protein E2C01_089901 [Portunus trituberculatus]|uniref:Uncharacterized protein n=1 Tax=Portunus trituberculatus TaxID=210409 RepID=A0A5B7JDA0_PORTR|nr:hypothetical protein [Portunus trituberculatus]
MIFDKGRNNKQVESNIREQSPLPVSPPGDPRHIGLKRGQAGSSVRWSDGRPAMDPHTAGIQAIVHSYTRYGTCMIFDFSARHVACNIFRYQGCMKYNTEIKITRLNYYIMPREII